MVLVMINNCICFEGIEIVKYLLFKNNNFLPSLFETCQSLDKFIRYHSLWTTLNLLTNINKISDTDIDLHNQIFKDSLKCILQVLKLSMILYLNRF